MAISTPLPAKVNEAANLMSRSLKMDRAVDSSTENVASKTTCDRCLRLLSPGWSFGFKTKLDPESVHSPVVRNELTKCLRCTLQHWPMLRKSLAACVVVGTILTALNQGDLLLTGQWNSSMWWKIPLTYTVPFMVATYGAMVNNRK